MQNFQKQIVLYYQVLSITFNKKRSQKPSTNAAADPLATRNYAAGFEYNGANALQHLATAEGRYVIGTGYEYFLKDHLGNVRIALNASGAQTQSTMYYPLLPYGKQTYDTAHKNSNTAGQRFYLTPAGWNQQPANPYSDDPTNQIKKRLKKT